METEMRSLPLKQTLGLGAAALVMMAGSAFAATLDTSVDLMSGPGSHYKTLGTLSAGDTITVTSEDKTWCKVTAPATGWVLCSDIKGLKVASVETKPDSTGYTGYDYNTDPIWGPNGGFHATHDNHFQ